MGMTIDEAIEYNKNLKMYMEINDEYDEYKFLEENHIALEMVINTMRKYQRIAELYDYWRSGKCEYTISCMENIGKILREVEDGNVD